MPSPPIVDPATIDLNVVEFDIEAIRKVNKQRFEMEQLSAIVRVDVEQRLIIAYKDLTEQDFWVRGHIPGRPLMPGVIMCESVAQAASFLIYQCLEKKPEFIGFGGMDGIKFRGQVTPGQRFVIVGQIENMRPRLKAFNAQAFVDSKMVFEGTIYGLPI